MTQKVVYKADWCAFSCFLTCFCRCCCCSWVSLKSSLSFSELNSVEHVFCCCLWLVDSLDSWDSICSSSLFASLPFHVFRWCCCCSFSWGHWWPFLCDIISLLSLLFFTVAPFCVPDQTTDYFVGLNEQVVISCEVSADPTEVAFKWFFNNSSSTTEIKNFTTKGVRSFMTFVPQSRYSYGTIFCVAENKHGLQSKPCIFNTSPVGPPVALNSCSVFNHSRVSVSVECPSPEDNSNQKQMFHLEVYRSSEKSLSSMSSDSSSSPHFESKDFVTNMTSEEKASFVISNLFPGTEYSIVMYSSNDRGRSHPLVLTTSTLSSPEKRTSIGQYMPCLVYFLLLWHNKASRIWKSMTTTFFHKGFCLRLAICDLVLFLVSRFCVFERRSWIRKSMDRHAGLEGIMILLCIWLHAWIR